VIFCESTEQGVTLAVKGPHVEQVLRHQLALSALCTDIMKPLQQKVSGHHQMMLSGLIESTKHLSSVYLLGLLDVFPNGCTHTDIDEARPK